MDGGFVFEKPVLFSQKNDSFLQVWKRISFLINSILTEDWNVSYLFLVFDGELCQFNSNKPRPNVRCITKKTPQSSYFCITNNLEKQNTSCISNNFMTKA
jgi:hypothetical protein